MNEADLSHHGSAIEAYHHLIYDLVKQQAASSNMVLNDTPVKRIFVDGGFSKNSVYMNLLAAGNSRKWKCLRHQCHKQPRWGPRWQFINSGTVMVCRRTL